MRRLSRQFFKNIQASFPKKLKCEGAEHQNALLENLMQKSELLLAWEEWKAEWNPAWATKHDSQPKRRYFQKPWLQTTLRRTSKIQLAHQE